MYECYRVKLKYFIVLSLTVKGHHHNYLLILYSYC